MGATQDGTADHAHVDGHLGPGGPVDAPAWDERYRGHDDEHLWSGEPNGTLVAEVDGFDPGTVLDVGCGEGGDAVWLAGRGWTVTAVEPSGVALDRARAAAAAAEVEVDWVHAGLLEMPGGTGRHDLVSAQYPALRHTEDRAAMAALAGAVAPGGTLLFVHHDVLYDPAHDDHDPDDHRHECRSHDGQDHDGDGSRVGDDHNEAGDHDQPDHDFDPDDYVLPHDMAAYLDEHEPGQWVVEVSEVRPRPGPLSPEARHVADVVFRARRTAPGAD